MLLPQLLLLKVRFDVIFLSLATEGKKSKSKQLAQNIMIISAPLNIESGESR
jgi:hypothetical protein